jgi:hypothetical protein
VGWAASRSQAAYVIRLVTGNNAVLASTVIYDPRAKGYCLDD